MQQSTETPSTPWVANAESAQFEDCLIGNREGFIQLRNAIDSALSCGEAPLPTNITDMMKIVVLDQPTNPECVQTKRGWRDALALITCGTALFAIAMLILFGNLYIKKI